MVKNILFNVAFWLLLWLIFAFSIMRIESVSASFQIASLILFPLIIPVYIHDFIFDYFVIRKQYILYFISTSLIVVFFGYIIAEFQYYFEPEGSSETYGALILMMVLYTGARYFRIGTQQHMRLKEEEEKRIRVEMELKDLAVRQAQAELNILKSQVNPHFLFNSLNSIYSLILSNSEIAGDAVLKLSDLMRYLLESSQKRKVLVKHELDFLKNYIDLEIIRLGKKADVKCKFTGDFGGMIISPLLLIPFIENCFKHGIGLNSKNDNKIEISVVVGDNVLMLETRNKIAPKRINPVSKKTGTGIANVKKRLELLYSEKHLLEIEHQDDIYLVKLKLEI
jgi:LytS/YehU family sensor histidine kinase